MFDFVKIRDGHDNFFTPIRLFLAVSVMIGHAYYVTDGHMFAVAPLAEPSIFFEYRPSYLAVNFFFIVSGFLVTRSLLNGRKVPEYISSRFLRVFPGLFVHILFVMFILGPLVTSLPVVELFTHPQFYTQPFQVLSFYRTEMILPGAFENNTLQVGSATLWTLRYEVIAYIGTLVMFLCGLMKANSMLLAQCMFFVVMWPLAQITGLYDIMPGSIQAILRLCLCYTMGAAIYAYRDRLKFHILGIPVIGCIAALYNDTVFFEVLVNIWMAYIVFWVAYVKLPKLSNLQTMTDISYGIYIYHYSILQWVYHVNPEVTTLNLILIASPISIVLAILSWNFIEKPMLSCRGSLANFLSHRHHYANIFHK